MTEILNSKPDADYSQFICGGYLLIRTAHAPQWIRIRKLLSDKHVSISSCIYPRFPDSYAISWCGNSSESGESSTEESYESMGILEQVRPAATDWATCTFDVKHGAWGIFFTAAHARKAYRKFLRDVSGVRLLAIGLHHSLVDEYLEQTRPEKPSPGFAPMGEGGQWTVLSQGKIFQTGGKFLGYELLVTQYGLLSCSWLCNELEEKLFSETGTRPNSHGLIADYDIALNQAASAASSGAEPGLWMPWAIVEYKL